MPLRAEIRGGHAGLGSARLFHCVVRHLCRSKGEKGNENKGTEREQRDAHIFIGTSKRCASHLSQPVPFIATNCSLAIYRQRRANVRLSTRAMLEARPFHLELDFRVNETII